jgi:hypothetical protein
MPDADISKWTGEDINAYLNELDQSPDISLTDWESTFVGSNLQRTNFSNAQRKVITDLVRKYGDDLA